MSSLYLLFCLSLSSKELERDEEDPEELEDSEELDYSSELEKFDDSENKENLMIINIE